MAAMRAGCGPDHAHRARATDVSGAVPGRVLAAATAGNLLEWYDWAVYGYLVTHIGRHFFPSDSGVASLLMSFAGFGAGFLARPLGALAIGWLAETRGRRLALLATLALMALGTVPIAFIPSHASIGAWAPALLLACRLLQGFSAGGELGGSLAYLAEWAPASRRGAYTSLQQASTQGGALLGAAVAGGLEALLGSAQMAQWGWRIPFLLGGLLLPLALVLRRKLPETPAWLVRGQGGAAWPDAGARRNIALALCLIAGPVACQYLFFTYMATFAVRAGGLSPAQALASTACALALLVLLVPAMGALSDRLGRRPVLVGASLALALLAAPAFGIVGAAPGVGVVLAVQAGMAVLVAPYHGAGPAAVAELFPTRGRALMLSLSYALGVALFGGFAPFAATWLVAATGSARAPALYVAVACCLSGAAAWRAAESARRRLA